MNESSIKKGDQFEFDLKNSDDMELANELASLGWRHGDVLEVLGTHDSGITEPTAAIQRVGKDIDDTAALVPLAWLAEASDSGVLRPVGNKGAAPANNDGRKTCYWCPGQLTQALSPRKHFCPVCGR
jgi:hypothetical protein